MIEFLGVDRDLLGHLLQDLAATGGEESKPEAEVEPESEVAVPSPAVPVARLYAEGGTGARDPRTGAAASRLKEVLRGNLDAFLEAWRRAGEQPALRSTDPSSHPVLF